MTTEELIEILKQHPGKRVFGWCSRGDGIVPIDFINVEVTGISAKHFKTWGAYDPTEATDPTSQETAILINV